MTMILFINPTSTYTITAFKHHEGLLESLLGFTLCCQFLELYRPPWQTFSIVSILSSCLLVPPGSFQLPHECHVLRPLFPPLAQRSHSHRPRAHDFVLPRKDDKNYIPRILYRLSNSVIKS